MSQTLKMSALAVALLVFVPSDAIIYRCIGLSCTKPFISWLVSADPEPGHVLENLSFLVVLSTYSHPANTPRYCLVSPLAVPIAIVPPVNSTTTSEPW
jgi:hypothetical protein